MKYFINTSLNGRSFEEAIDLVTEKLKEEGFGVLSEINVTETLKNKIDVDFKPYRILGACNPAFAHKALSAEDKIGVMLPCNVVVEQNGDGSIEVSAVDPMASMSAVDNDKLGELAAEVQQKLTKVIESLN